MFTFKFFALHMYQIINRATISLLLVTLSIVKVNAQTTSPDNLGQKTAAQNLESYFNVAVKEQSKLFNGAFYEYYLPRITGSAYFRESSEFTKGSVLYDGFLYEDVPLLYDLYRDLLISTFYKVNFKFSLVSEKVTEFKIDNHHFVYLNRGADTDKSIKKTGFYDLLYNGKIKIYCKRVKLMQEENDGRYANDFFVSKNDYYLEKDNMIYQFEKQASFFNLFKSEKVEMKKFLKKKEIKFKDNPEYAMVLLASYYDNLPN